MARDGETIYDDIKFQLGLIHDAANAALHHERRSMDLTYEECSAAIRKCEEEQRTVRSLCDNLIQMVEHPTRWDAGFLSRSSTVKSPSEAYTGLASA